MVMKTNAWRGLYVVGGPTGVGKTRYGLAVARRFHTEIISADSMQVYKHFNIGTAKPTEAQCGDVQYHLIDIVDPKEEGFDLATYIRLADEIIRELHTMGRIPLVVGGTGLYLQGLLERIFNGPGKNEAIRQELERVIARRGIAALYDRLREVDPEQAERVHPNDRVRIIRALEVFELTGKPISSLQRESREKAVRYPYRMVALTRERSDLYARIERRVEEMFSAGFVDEVRDLEDKSYGECIHSMQALGYYQVLEYLQGRRNLEDVKSEIKKLTRNYAKRQLTWFRHMKNAHWLNITGKSDADIVESICSVLTQANE
jgi:tRNA dimethylallyltransferase